MDKGALAVLALLAVFALVVFGPAFAGGGELPAPTRPDKVVKTDAEWKSSLDAEEYRILRGRGTERAFTGKYWDDHEAGTYVCAACGLELFTSADKFDSGTGWPSYTKPIAADRVDSHVDSSYGMTRTEVTCARCGGHLGHVFDDGPKPTGQRFCINGNALDKVVAPAAVAPPAK
jgi:peptide-methionine (R)-S-oxide reductase